MASYNPHWNNQYMAYQPYGQQVNLPSFATQGAYQQPVNGIVKVNGRDSALQYPMPPNSTSPALFDNNGQVFYVVSTDGTGTKTVEAFDFSPHEDKPIQIDGAQFVSRREFDEFAAKVNAVIGARNGSYEPVPAYSAGGSATDGAEGTHVNASPDDARGQRGASK